MRAISMAVCVFLSVLAVSAEARADEAQDARLQGWINALDSIDTAIGVGTAGDVAVSVVCIFAGPTCDAAKRTANRIVIKYRRIAMRSWRARGISLPGKCLSFEIDGAQLDRVMAAYERARPNISRGGVYLLSAYDFLGYGFIPVNDLECQDTARKEILRVRGLSEPAI